MRGNRLLLLFIYLIAVQADRCRGGHDLMLVCLLNVVL